MEEDQPNINTDDKKLELNNILVTKSEEEEIKNGASSSNEDRKKTEHTKPKAVDSMENPEIPKDTPEMPTDKPEMPTDKPETSKDTPEIPTDKPETSKDKPEKPTDKPETSMDKPEILTNKPEKPKDKPEKIKDKPEKIKDKPEKIKDKLRNMKDNIERIKDTFEKIKGIEKIKDKPVKIKDKLEKMKDKPEKIKDKLEKVKEKPEKPRILRSPLPLHRDGMPLPRTPTPNRGGSPEPSCAICLEQLTNKSFTNSCFHMFCFTCLLEWSKVKPECPLCKQSFTSIVHNVKSFQEYDQYHISARSKTPDWSFDRRFRYSTTATSDRYLSRTQQAIENSIVNEIASHRLRYAPHSVHTVRMYSQPQMARRVPCVYRRRIYEESLWVRPPSGDRIRIATPVFFQRNIACTHRLLPWLNRELLVVMPHNEGEIGFMIDLIMSLILKYNITSPEFFTHIEPYTAPYTSHFIHELYNFAISPFEMESYDFHAQYEVDPMEAIRVSSPDSDVVALPMSDSTQKSSTSSDTTKRKKKHSRERNLAKYKRRLEKIVLKRNSENNCWETVATSFPMLNYNEVSSSNRFEGPGPSTSWDTILQNFAAETSRQELEKSSEVECVQDDEIEILDVLKPKRERTPEIVNLSSGDEEEYTATAEVSSTVNEPPAGVIELSSDVPISSADEDDVLFLEERQTFTKAAISDKPIDYSLKTADKLNTTIEIESEKSKSPEIDPCLSSSKENTETEQRPESPKKCLTLKSAVKVLTNDNDSRSSSWSPLNKPKKRRATILDDSSTESCSEGAQVTELDSRIKKLKLRSVVAHFSFDPSDEKTDSTHHSSMNKRHKDRKKKKKKHKHRHHRIYSSEST